MWTSSSDRSLAVAVRQQAAALRPTVTMETALDFIKTGQYQVNAAVMFRLKIMIFQICRNSDWLKKNKTKKKSYIFHVKNKNDKFSEKKKSKREHQQLVIKKT